MNLDELFKRSHLVVILLGLIIFLVAAIGSLPINGQIPLTVEPAWRYLLAILGCVLVVVGLYLLWQEQRSSKEKTEKKLQEPTDFRNERAGRPPVLEDRRRRRHFPAYGKVHFCSDPIAALEIVSGPLQGAWLFLTSETGKVIVGRSEDPDIISLHNANYIDEDVSRKHFAISVVTNEEKDHHLFKVIDLDSANGTYINGAELAPYRSCELSHGDEIWAGDTIFVFYFLALKRDRQGRNHHKSHLDGKTPHATTKSDQ